MRTSSTTGRDASACSAGVASIAAGSMCSRSTCPDISCSIATLPEQSSTPQLLPLMTLHRLCLALAAALTATAAPLPAQRTTPGAALPRDFDAYVGRVLRQFEVPGVAIAVVQDGRVLLAKGYGVRTLGQPAPVDEHTLFGIAFPAQPARRARLSH